MVQFNTISSTGANVYAISMPDANEKKGLLAGRVVTKQAGENGLIPGSVLFCFAICAIGISLGMLMPAVYVTSLSNGAAIALTVIGSIVLVGGVSCYFCASSAIT